MSDLGAEAVLPPREDKIRETLKSLKVQIFDLEISLDRSVEPERLGTIAQSIVLSASVINQLASLPALPRFERAVLKKAVAKTT